MKAFKSDTSQTIFDVALAQYGGLQGLAILLGDNPGLVLEDGTINQFGVTHLVSGVQVAADELERSGAQKAVPEVIEQEQVYYSNGQQTVFDVALMQYGSVGGLMQLLTDNPGLIQTNGVVTQFRISHRITRSVATDIRLKPKMLALVPSTEGGAKGQQPWITINGNSWITEDDKAWMTK